MKKPNGYDEAQAGRGQKEAIKVGGHHLEIKQVNESTNRNGRPMIVVLFDMAKNDSQPGMMMKEFKADDRPDKKWPFRASQYINVQDYDDPEKTSRQYKAFCTCFEQSNGCKINWVEDPNAWAAQFKGKKIGGAFGVVHSAYNGREIERVELRWFISDNNVDGCEVPMEKGLSAKDMAELNEAAKKQQGAADSSFVEIPDGVDEDLPFS